MRYGGPILYLFVYTFVLFLFLVWYDLGGVILPEIWRRMRRKAATPAAVAEAAAHRTDVLEESETAKTSSDALRVLNISKTYGATRVVDDVSFTVGSDTIFALLGPNGAGKTTTFNIIR